MCKSPRWCYQWSVPSSSSPHSLSSGGSIPTSAGSHQGHSPTLALAAQSTPMLACPAPGGAAIGPPQIGRLSGYPSASPRPLASNPPSVMTLATHVPGKGGTLYSSQLSVFSFFLCGYRFRPRFSLQRSP